MRQELVIPRRLLDRALATLVAGTARRGPRAAANPWTLPVAVAHTQLVENPQFVSWPVIDLSIAGNPETFRPPRAPAPIPVEPTRAGRIAIWWVGNADSRYVPREPDAWRRFCLIAAQRLPWLTLLDDVPWMTVAIHASGEISALVRIEQRWLPLARIRLPGPHMTCIDLDGATTVEADVVPDAGGRYSRVAGALGDNVLGRLQRSVIAVVGAGRTGSYAANTLVRYGASVLLIDPDTTEVHNAGDADELDPVEHIGRPKVEALSCALRGKLRSGATIEAHHLGVHSRAAGLLLARAAAVVSTVDSDVARLWTTAWAAAHLLPHLDVGVAVPNEGDIGFDVRLTLPGEGCLACIGGYADALDLARRLQTGDARPDDFRAQRRGSLRSVGHVAVGYGVRLLEHLYDGRLAGNRFVQWHESAAGLFRQQDWVVPPFRPCPLCGQVSGLGAHGDLRAVVAPLARRLAAAAQATR